MTWNGAADVLAVGAQPPRVMPAVRRRYRLGLVLALIMLLLAGTALALGLLYSDGYSRRKQADQALMDTYDFTQEAMGMFLTETASVPDGVQIAYRSHMQDEQVGTYTVLLPRQGKPVVRWSHDDADPTQLAGGLDAPIWGAKQLNAYVRIKNAYYQKSSEFDWQNVGSWTLEQRAQADVVLTEMQQAFGEAIPTTHITPGPDDIQPDDAVHLALEALADTFGVDTAHITALDQTVAFTRNNVDGTRRYRVQYDAYKRVVNPSDVSFEAFHVDIMSPSGKAENAHWYIGDPEKRTLPEGDLTGHRTAIEQFIDNGSFEVLPALEKGKLAERISHAGHNDLLGSVTYVIPGPGVISETAALEKAAQVLLARHGLTGSMHSLFTVSAALVRRENHVVWQVQYKGNDVPYWGVHAVPPVGDYTAWLYA
ncbi:MAG: hypothetical protein GX810_09375, partial [Clostridiales bacterium]|nr:hypothetical protein [Clostridiales bacterium]